MGKPNIYDNLFAERMSKIVQERFNGNYSEFARAVGVSQPSLKRWAEGEADPTRTNLIKISEVANVSIDWLATGKSQQQAIGSSDSDDSNEDVVYIDDFREFLISAGFGAINNDYYEADKVAVESNWLHNRRLKAQDCAMFKVDGDSMEPTLQDGQDIIVDRAKTDLREGKIFVLQHQGSMWVKKVRVNFDNIQLISDNNDYPPITLTSDEADELQVIGQVVRGYRDF
ncbi:LexA family transcriptional regulator [Pasteurellaceae bacterium HPA106]|uniref:S24 family peptidase n=1 Tax=Spirabiliibacterium pneumoniae TaxID=221400 RepID=UPI001AAD7A0B|nr:S24 family peptidase [Spirabiliibacterium pneumoniae]MBE2896768.1 LexA family transcriptional regulator [Spirabiliibacterium pneumoniae]